MDSDHILPFLEPSTGSPKLDTNHGSQSSCTNQSLSLLQSLCSDEDTVKHYLQNDELNNQNHIQQFFDSSIENWFGSEGPTNLSEISWTLENLDSSTLNTDYISQSDTLALQPISQPSCLSQSLSLLQAFCSDEDTVRKYLLNEDDLNNPNHEQLSFDSSEEIFFNFNDPINSFERSWTIENLTPVQTHFSSPIPTDLLTVDRHYSNINYSYDELRSNFILLVERGYKLVLSLNTDNSQVEEPWNPDVGRKILSVYFSSLSLRNEYLPDDVQLNGFESILMTEALTAFKGQKNLNLFSNLNDRRRAKASPNKLISICNGIKDYRKIEISDKIILLSSIYYHLHGMDGIMNYDADIDGWDIPTYDFKHDRRDMFLYSRKFHDEFVQAIESFPDRLRNDINTIILIYLIVIFNPDSPGLRHPEIIRRAQFSYIYLLRRYLRTICESECQASDNHYRLMVKIEHWKCLAEQAKKELNSLVIEPLEETVAKAITSEYQKLFSKCFGCNS